MYCYCTLYYVDLHNVGNSYVIPCLFAVSYIYAPKKRVSKSDTKSEARALLYSRERRVSRDREGDREAEISIKPAKVTCHVPVCR